MIVHNIEEIALFRTEDNNCFASIKWRIDQLSDALAHLTSLPFYLNRASLLTSYLNVFTSIIKYNVSFFDQPAICL